MHLTLIKYLSRLVCGFTIYYKNINNLPHIRMLIGTRKNLVNKDIKNHNKRVIDY